MLTTLDVYYQDGSLALADESQGSLTLTSSTARVQWLIHGCPNDCFPRIEFIVDDQQPRALGPFDTLRTNPSYVISDGLSLETRGFRYRLSLNRKVEDGPEVLVALLDDLELAVTATAETTGLKILVEPAGDGRLTTTPELAVIRTGDTVEWIFQGFAATPQWVPRVSFLQAPAGSHVVAPHFGPFTSLTVEEDRVIGAGNNGVIGEFSYLVQAIDATTGEPLHSAVKDPGVANGGDPPGGGGG